MGIETIIGAGLGLYGANKASSAAKSAADTQAKAARDAAAIQAEASRFRPVGVTTAFGGSQFGFDPEGNLTSAGYTLSPELATQQQQLMGMLPGQLAQALQTDQYYGDLAGRFRGLGEQALGQVQLDPMQAAQARTERLQALMAPGRAEAQERLFSNLAAKGLTGLATEGGTGARVNPYMAALASEQAIQDQALAAESLDRARADIATDIARATGLFGTAQANEQFQAGRLGQALAPYQALLGQAQGLEGLGAATLDASTALGAGERTAAQAAAAAQAQGLLSSSAIQGQASAARAAQQAQLLGGLGNQVSQMDFSNFTNPFSGLFGGSSQDSGFRFYNTPAGSAPFSLTQQSSFAPTSPAGQYASGFNFSLAPQASTNQAFAVPDYRPPTFTPLDTYRAGF